MRSVEVQLYRSRAQDFLQGMLLTRGDEQFCNSAALLGIHAAISYADALRIGLGEAALASEDHRTAANALYRLIPANEPSAKGGVKRLMQLIDRKSRVSYGNKRLDRSEFELIYTHAERFAKLANDLGRSLKIEGWNDADQ